MTVPTTPTARYVKAPCHPLDRNRKAILMTRKQDRSIEHFFQLSNPPVEEEEEEGDQNGKREKVK